MSNEISCWVLSDGTPGMENQGRGLAEALDLEPELLRIVPRSPWKYLPPRLWFAPLSAPGPGGDVPAPPWPRLLIATGRQTVALSVAIRRQSRGGTFTVQIQNPRIDPGNFDMVIAPSHDRLTGDNVLTTTGALHRITPARLAAAAERFRGRLDALPRPLVAVLVGGANGQYRMETDCTRRLADGLGRLMQNAGAGLAVTASRRTGAANERLLRDTLAGDTVEFWDGEGENPYFAYLALADAFVVTGDSVNMVTEACATGKPVFVFDLDGGSAKFRRFHAAMEEAGLTRPFTGELAHWDHPPADDMGAIAGAVRDRLGQSAVFPK